MHRTMPTNHVMYGIKSSVRFPQRYRGIPQKVEITMAVGRIVILLVTLLGFFGVQGYFDCQRSGQDCVNGKTCSDNGTCDCGDSYTGYNCGLSMSEKNKSPCTSETDSCGTDGGLCYNNGGTKTCYCPANLYGDHCENKRYTVECKMSSMKITLTPAGNFDGIIFVDGEKDTDGCTFPDSNETLELDLQDTVCGAVTPDTESGDRTRVIKMQYSSKYITDRDTKLTVTCSSGAGTVDVTASFTSQDSDGNTKEQAIQGMADLASDAVDFVIKLKDDSVVNSSTVVPLNDQLTFQFNVNREKVPGGESCKVTESTGYQSKGGPDKELLDVGSADDCKSICKEDPLCKAVDYFATMKFCHLFHRVITLLSYSSKYVHYDIDCGSVTVTQCEASNGQSEDNKETMKLIENSCPSDVVGKLMEQDPILVTNSQVVFKMHPFKFNHNNAISIECTVKVCSVGSSAECPIPDCRGLTRKRRSADRSDERVRRTIFILDPEFKSTRKSDSSKNKSVSVNDVTTPIVAGIAIVIILLLVCIVVLLVVKKRRSNQKSQDEGVNNHTI